MPGCVLALAAGFWLYGSRWVAARRSVRAEREVVSQLLRLGGAPIGRGELWRAVAERLARSGYRARLDVAGSGARWQARPLRQGPAGGPWVVWAWPVRFGGSGRRAFVLFPDGRLFAAENESGRMAGGAEPPPGPPFTPPAGARACRGPDGTVWRLVRRPGGSRGEN